MSPEDVKEVEEKNSDADEKISDEKISDDAEDISDEKISDDVEKISDEKNSYEVEDVSDEKNSDDAEDVADEKNSEDVKISEDKEDSTEEKISDTEKVEDKKTDDEKNSDSDKKIIAELNEPTFKEKLSAKFNNARDYLDENFGGYFEDISLKYVAAIFGGVIFCIGVIGLVLIFADPLDTAKRNVAAEDSQEKRVHIKIRDGMSTGEIADQLESKNIIASSLKFRILSRIRGYDGKMKPGTYTFYVGMPEDEVFKKILNGEKVLIKFTIPEGFGVKEIAERLYSLDLADKEDFLKAAEKFAPYKYMEKRKNSIFAAEGFLFPDTYTVESDISVEEILKIMTGDFDSRLTTEMRVQAQQMGLSVYDLVTLASLVEKEVRYPEDRPIVAQVFLKRLQINMPLQTDASLQYLMDAPKEDVSIEDTKIESLYNTYQHYGLPPGPIANPGMDSIEAVLNPADTDYLYFVADRNGHNHYSQTYEEHLYLVNQYR